MNSERVPQVVKAWLVGRFVMTRDARDPSQANETLLDHLDSDGIANLCLEQGSIVLILPRRHFEILLKQRPNITPERHQSRFIELQASDRNQPDTQIYIHEPEAQRFPESPAEAHMRPVLQWSDGKDRN